ncbi:MAG: hypothetical protein II563_02515 [Treponema sp.]|nr:hypothetical protein [Treponema sp.]MBQ2551707.1 hypothetical protein [Treponema sp.]MBQ4236768.1 hypothetical protein [Treponema sp.]
MKSIGKLFLVLFVFLLFSCGGTDSKKRESDIANHHELIDISSKVGDTINLIGSQIDQFEV